MILWANFMSDIVVCLLFGGGNSWDSRRYIFGQIFLYSILPSLGTWYLLDYFIFGARSYKHALDICSVKRGNGKRLWRNTGI